MGTRRPHQSKSELYQRQVHRNARRFKIVWLFVLLFFGFILFKLADIQIVNAQKYQKKAKNSHSQSMVLYNRGRILDRNGVVLAQDTILYDVFAHPRYYYKTSPATLAAILAPLLGEPEAKLLKKLQLPYETISLKKNITKPEALRIQALKLPGIDIPRKMIRRYPQGRLASHLIGYVNDDASISTGIERSAEKILRSPPALPDIELNGRGDFIDVQNIDPALIVNLPKTQDVQLTLDARVQYAAESALARGLKTHKAKGGAVIVLNPANGEILAFATFPDFDPEHYYKAPQEHLKNWAITDVYPPGSTFKILTIASGLETGVIHRESKLHDTGFITMNGFSIKNYDYASRGAPGDIDLVYLFQHSSNIGSLLVSLMMDPADHHRLLKNFGLGQKTHIDIPGESAGILHPPEKWDQLTHATIGYGYGLATTPLQMAAAISAIANKGVWVTPHLLVNQANVTKHRAISEKTAHLVTQLLSESIEAAASSTVRLPGFHVAGKTGTSRKPALNGKGYSSELFTSFVGYLPAEDPQVLIMVVVDSPGAGNAWGSTVAGPIFKEIALQTIGYLGLKPSVTLTHQQSSAKPSM